MFIIYSDIKIKNETHSSKFDIKSENKFKLPLR